MSVAALEGLALDRALASRPALDRLWRPFLRAATSVVETPWTIAAGSDFAFPGVTGAKPAGTDVVNWYLDRVHRVASTDRVVCRTFFDVANLLKPSTTLFGPRVITRVAKGCLWPTATEREPASKTGNPISQSARVREQLLAGVTGRATRIDEIPSS